MKMSEVRGNLSLFLGHISMHCSKDAEVREIMVSYEMSRWMGFMVCYWLWF